MLLLLKEALSLAGSCIHSTDLRSWCIISFRLVSTRNSDYKKE